MISLHLLRIILQELAHVFGGSVAPCEHREYGRASARRSPGCDSALFDGLPEEFEVWMSHGDKLTEVPNGFEAVGELVFHQSVTHDDVLFLREVRPFCLAFDAFDAFECSCVRGRGGGGSILGKEAIVVDRWHYIPSDAVVSVYSIFRFFFPSSKTTKQQQQQHQPKPAPPTHPTSPSRTSSRRCGGYNSTRR